MHERGGDNSMKGPAISFSISIKAVVLEGLKEE